MSLDLWPWASMKLLMLGRQWTEDLGVSDLMSYGSDLRVKGRDFGLGCRACSP